jgi:hypothetical protein
VAGAADTAGKTAGRAADTAGKAAGRAADTAGVAGKAVDTAVAAPVCTAGRECGDTAEAWAVIAPEVAAAAAARTGHFRTGGHAKTVEPEGVAVAAVVAKLAAAEHRKTLAVA